LSAAKYWSALALDRIIHSQAEQSIESAGDSIVSLSGNTETKPDESSGQDAGPAEAVKSNGQGRKRGPKPNHDAAACAAEIVARIAPEGNWKDKLQEICKALDLAEIPYPKTWPTREVPLNSWEDGATLDPELAKKAIDHWLDVAKQRKKPTAETFS
jgi:hypothetical protein